MESESEWQSSYAERSAIMSLGFNGVIHKPSRDTYLAGWHDYEAGYYWPLPPESPKYGEYIMGWNDAWAKAEGVVLVR